MTQNLLGIPVCVLYVQLGVPVLLEVGYLAYLQEPQTNKYIKTTVQDPRMCSLCTAWGSSTSGSRISRLPARAANKRIH